MIVPGWIYKKFRAEVDGLYALGRYGISKDALLDRLSNAMPGVTIETTNICNANCVFCAYQYQERDTGVMKMDLFRKVVDDFAEAGGGTLGLTPTVGDPLADKHLLDRISYARQKANITAIGMHSNMIALERFGAESLVRSGLTSLVVSTSGFDEAMYERVYRSREYRRVLKNIIEFARADAAASWPVDLLIDMRADRPSSEVTGSPDFKKVIDIVGRQRMAIKYRYDNWAGKIVQEDLSGGMRLRRPHSWRTPRISPCSEMYNGPMVYWDGKVGACGCRDVDARELIIGDVNKQHLADIWLGQEIRKLRAEFLTPAVQPICTSCTHYQNVSIYLRPDRRNLLASVKPVSNRPRPT